MKPLSRRRKWIIGTAATLLLTATPSFALFGLGDIVFDPTSYASLVSQLTTLQTQYTMRKKNITHFFFKQQWQTTLTALKNVNVRIFSVKLPASISPLTQTRRAHPSRAGRRQQFL